MRRFFSLLWKAGMPWFWIVGYIAASVLLTNVGISATEYTAKMFAGNVDFFGVIVPFLAASIVSMLIASVSGIIGGFCQARIDRNLRRVVWKKIVHLPFGFYQSQQPKELISRMTTDISTISNLIVNVFVSAIISLYSVILLFGQIGSYDKTLMVTTFLLLPLQVAIGAIAGRLKFGLTDEVNQRNAELTEGIAQRTGQAMLIKSFSAEEKEKQTIGERTKRYYQAYIRNSWVTNLINPVYTIVAALQFILIVMIGRRFYANGAISLVQWVAFFAFANEIITYLSAYTGYWTSLKTAQGATHRVSDIVAEKDENLTEGREAGDFSGDIVFDHLDFSFGEKPLFRDLNLTIPCGQATAVIGRSGSGKTTLLNLLERLYDPESGDIRIGSESLLGLSKKSCREKLTYITQESIMLNGTIRENLLFGINRPVDDEELDAVTESVQIKDYIDQLPEGYETLVGEDGSRFSGGQKQKLAAARGMLKKTDYFLMDEATAAMDAEAKDAVWQAVSTLMKGKTTLYVAHDRQTVLKADYVVVMEEGKVVDQGPIETVYETNAYLRELIGEGGLDR